MATILIWSLVGLFILGLIVLTALYFANIGPYNDRYQFRDPRTWKPSPETNSWLTPDFPYGQTDRNVPSPDIKNVYCKYDPNRCIPTQSTFSSMGTPTSC